MEITLGSELLNNYRGNLNVTTKNGTISVKNSKGETIQPGKRVLPIDTYTINGSPREDYTLEEFTLNGQPIDNDYLTYLRFGNEINLTLKANREGVIESDVSMFRFDESIIIGYIGDATDVTIPASYSISGTREIECNYGTVGLSVISSYLSMQTIFTSALFEDYNFIMIDDTLITSLIELWNYSKTKEKIIIKTILCNTFNSSSLQRISFALKYPLICNGETYSKCSDLYSNFKEYEGAMNFEFGITTENNYTEGNDFTITGMISGALNSGEPMVSLKSNVKISINTLNLLGQPYLAELDLTNFKSVLSSNLIWCPKLSELIIPSGMSSLYLQCAVGLKKLEFLGPNLPNTLRLTSMYSLGEMIFPEGISDIYVQQASLPSLYKLTIPESVTSISIPSSCYNLVEIYNKTGDDSILPSSLTQYVKNVYTPTSGESKLIYDGDFVYFQDIFSFDLVYYSGDSENVVITPPFADDLTIKRNLFYGRVNMKNLTLPPNIKTIETTTFTYSNNLENVYITDLNSYCNIDMSSISSSPTYYASAGSPNYKNLYLNNNLLTTFTYPNNIVDTAGNRIVKPYTFNGCKSLQKVIIPAEIISIGASTFDNCPNLKTIEFKGILPPSISSSSFDVDVVETVIVPIGRLSEYQSAYTALASKMIEAGDDNTIPEGDLDIVPPSDDWD